MKIALLYLDALRSGGYPRDVRWLASEFARLGHEVTLIAREGKETDGLQDVGVVRPERFRSLYPNVDLVHSWGLFLPAQIGVEWLSRRKGGSVPTIVSPLAQLMPLHLGRSVWKKVPYLALLRPALRGVRHVAHFFSEEEYWASVHYLQPTAHFEATLGLFPPPGGALPSDSVGDYLLFFGRNDITQKGIDVLVEGYRLARREGLELPLVVAGQPDKRSVKYWKKVKRDVELSQHVELMGEVPDEERSRLLVDARCLVFPSRWDGPPRPIREAIALGTPVIVTNGTNMGQLVESYEAGELVALEAKSICEGLLNAADDARAKGWREGTKRLRESLSWDRVALEYMRGYEMTLASS
jgi:glycosyltransferase involved in cell wall biosynthesis